MPTEIHELSNAAALYKTPVSARSKIDWLSVPLSDGMNEDALALQRYCLNAGLTPLASEWWHFNDYVTLDQIDINLRSSGDFFPGKCFSVPPPNNEEQ
jgi:D-alanyl-D-alanine dipeptidase